MLTAVRRAGPADRSGEPYRHWIDVRRSSDAGATWSLLGTAVDDTGPGGNPPALVALPDGRLVISYLTSSVDIWQVATDARLYWPTFVTVEVRDGRPPASAGIVANDEPREGK